MIKNWFLLALCSKAIKWIYSLHSHSLSGVSGYPFSAMMANIYLKKQNKRETSKQTNKNLLDWLKYWKRKKQQVKSNGLEGNTGYHSCGPCKHRLCYLSKMIIQFQTWNAFSLSNNVQSFFIYFESNIYHYSKIVIMQRYMNMHNGYTGDPSIDPPIDGWLWCLLKYSHSKLIGITLLLAHWPQYMNLLIFFFFFFIVFRSKWVFVKWVWNEHRVQWTFTVGSNNYSSTDFCHNMSKPPRVKWSKGRHVEKN